MKFYNPWKPHIVVDSRGYYYVRIRSGSFWLYFNEYWELFYHDKESSTSTLLLDKAEFILGLAVNHQEVKKESKRLSKIKDKVIHQ